MQPMIKTDDLSFSYTTEEGQRRIHWRWTTWTCTIEKGSFVVVLGHNGSGKSTLAKHMNAILLPIRRRGVCGGHGHRATRRSCWTIRRTRGHGVPEPGQPDRGQRGGGGCGLRPGEPGRAPGGDPPPGGRRPARRWACTSSRAHAPHLLSGGQKQRVAIAGVHRHASRSASCWTRPRPCWTPSGRREVLDTVHAAEPGAGHHRGAHHPPHGRGGARPTA